MNLVRRAEPSNRIARTVFVMVCLLASACTSLLGVTDIVPAAGAADGGANSDASGSPIGREGGSDGGPDQAASPGPDAGLMLDTGAIATPDGDMEDAGPTFENPLQVDASSLFNANTIVTTADDGIALTYMDGDGTNEGNDFPTTSEMIALGQSTEFGLPNDAFFPASNMDTPNVHLGWNNGSNLQYNSLWVSSASGTEYTLSLPPGLYSQVQLYATGAAGASTLSYTLNYKDGSVPLSLTLPDWCDQSQATNGEFTLAYVYRVEYGMELDTANPSLVCHIYALNLNPANNRVLNSVTFEDVVLGGGSTANLVFYGATAWR